MHDHDQTFADPRAECAETLDIDSRGDTETWRVALAGEVDAITGTQLHEAVVDVLRHHCPRRIEMDLRKVAFLDSVGIMTLLSCHSDAEQVNCQLRITDASPMVHRVLEITCLLDHFRVTAVPHP
jgi:anti-anti-sigma factor